jgi:hypothetical protein
VYVGIAASAPTPGRSLYRSPRDAGQDTEVTICRDKREMIGVSHELRTAPMTAAASKPVRSPSYPSMPLRDAVIAVRKIEGPYRSAPVDRLEASKLVGYSSMSGPANQALSSLAAYGLIDRAGKGMIRVTPRAKAILHPNNDDEFKRNLRAAGSEPQLFQQILEHFSGVQVPPESGVVSYLNRQGFNQSAIRPAVKAFLQTMYYLEEAGVSESHGPAAAPEPTSGPSNGDDRPQFGGAKVGDLVQWESNGALRLAKPERVRWISDDGNWLALAHEDYKSAIAMAEVIVQERASTPLPPPTPPAFVGVAPPAVDEGNESGGTDFRFKVGKGIVVKVSSPDELGADEINKLVALLQAQAIALS